jgi:hypothetical protein
MIERPILYLDIDGVILRRRLTSARVRDAFEVARHAPEFLHWAVTHFDARWLSSRCELGESKESDTQSAMRLAPVSFHPNGG